MITTEPVAWGNLVTVVFALFGGYFAKYGITEDDANEFVAVLFTALGAIGALVSIFTQRAKVTPLKDPRDNDGTSLVPLDEAA